MCIRDRDRPGPAPAEDDRADRYAVGLLPVDVYKRQVQVFRQTKGGYTTQSIDPLPPAVNTNRMYHFIDCMLGKATPFVLSLIHILRRCAS